MTVGPVFQVNAYLASTSGTGPVFQAQASVIRTRGTGPVYQGTAESTPSTITSPGVDAWLEFATGSVLGPGVEGGVKAIPGSVLGPGVEGPVLDLLDYLAPKPPVLTGNQQTASQSAVATHGETTVTIRWTIPSENEDIGGEFIGAADGATQPLQSGYAPIVGSPTVYEMSGFGGVGFGDTTLSAGASLGDTSITVTDPTDFAIGNFVQLDDGTQREYLQIADIVGSVLELATRIICCTSLPSGTTTVKEVQSAVVKTITTDYTFVSLTGAFSLVSGQWTPGRDVVISYAALLQDLAGFTLFRNQTLLADDSYAAVLADGGSVLLSDALSDSTTSYQEVFPATENGETWYYYLYAKDDETSINRSAVATQPGGGPLQVDTIPSVPQNLDKTVGDSSVALFWDSLGPGGSDTNTDGYNIYRHEGLTLNAANLRKLNQAPIPKAQLTFDDSSAGVISGDRVPAGTIPLPVNGTAYTYVIEAEDTVSSWTTESRNQSFGLPAINQASKTP